MSYIIGQNAEILLDGTGYYVVPATYKMKQPRVRRGTTRADAGEAYVDLGPGKRVWSMVILCRNDLTNYDGTAAPLTGQQYRDALRTSYLQVGVTVNFTDPQNGTAIAVHFDSYAETIEDLHSQQIPLAVGASPGLSYLVAIELVEG